VSFNYFFVFSILKNLRPATEEGHRRETHHPRVEIVSLCLCVCVCVCVCVLFVVFNERNGGEWYGAVGAGASFLGQADRRRW